MPPAIPEPEPYTTAYSSSATNHRDFNGVGEELKSAISTGVSVWWHNATSHPGKPDDPIVSLASTDLILIGVQWPAGQSTQRFSTSYTTKRGRTLKMDCYAEDGGTGASVLKVDPEDGTANWLRGVKSVAETQPRMD